jgi:4-hydroxy-tetrahydrodipicolinate synthase
LVHTCAHNTAEAAELTRFARENGADGIGCTTPYFYTMDESAQYQFFSSVLEAADGLPSYLYNIPQCSGNVIGLPLMQRLKSEFAHVRGTKDSGGDMERFKSLIELGLPDFQVICGADHETLTALKLGGTASVTSTGNAYPELFQAVYDAFEKGDLEGAEQAQERLTALTKVLFEGRLVAAYKVALGYRGVDAGTVRSPQRELTDEEKAAVKSGLDDLGLLP